MSGWSRLLNTGSVLGFVVGVGGSILLSLAAGWDPGGFALYVTLPFALSFPLFRLLPIRGVRAVPYVLVALPFLWLLSWWGGTGLGLALVLATFIPNHIRLTSLSRETTGPTR